MKIRFAIACLVLNVGALDGHAEWYELKGETGQVVEIVADFRIEDLRIDASGTASFVAKAVVDGEEMGFTATLSKAELKKTGVIFQKSELQLMQCDLDIRSLGPATIRLEQRLNQRLGIVAGGENALFLVGAYSASSPLTAASVAEIALVQGRSVGITYDQNGGRVAGDCFGLRLVIDGPMSRVTANFYEPGAPCGTVKSTVAREQWLHVHGKKDSGKPTQATTKAR